MTTITTTRTVLLPGREPATRNRRATSAVLLRALLVVLLATMAAVAGATSASAHPLSTTAILLDVGDEAITGVIEVPVDRLALALGDPTLTSEAAVVPAELTTLTDYVAQHTAATGADGSAWTVAVDGGRIQSIDAVDHLVLDLTLTPPQPGAVGDVVLSYDAVVERLLSHQILVSARGPGDTDYSTVGVITWQDHELDVAAADLLAADGTGVGEATGFLSAVRLGVAHISDGADHLLFLVMLLLPAPLLARGGRWVRRRDLRRASWRVVHVVTAFAVGHSITLALAALGHLTVDSRVVESLIAVSILASAVHAIKPLVPGGERLIAAGFGLVHGLAFAAVIDTLGLGRGSVVRELLGFNLGIEITQLLVVLLLIPSLLLLSSTRAYPAVRTGLAAAGAVLAAAWLAERTSLLTTNPLNGVTDVLIAHPFLVAAVLAAVAVTVRGTPRLRVPPPRPAAVPDLLEPAGSA